MAVAIHCYERFLNMHVFNDIYGWKRWVMKSRFQANFAILILALGSAFSLSALAQTTDEGTGPSEQPSAPMEMGQQGPNAPAPNGQPSDAQPTEAQPGGPEGEAPAKTDQGVARISLMHGDVSTQRGDSGDWSAAVLNQPVMTGDKVSTGDNARTELQLDFANILRLGANSKANFVNLTQKDIQIQLGQGIANFTVSKDSEAEPEIDTPNVSIHPAHHDGVFRIEVRPDGDTIVIVRQGQAQIATPQGSTEVNAGEMATVRGDSNSAQYKISQAPDRDDWDRWNSDRDHMIRNANSWRHTNRYYTGAEDLDANGQWQNVPDYGDVWEPNEPEGWAPYQNGNWVYEPYYGWTWVGYEPWGWAPYHYGRWFSYGGRWAWWPGPIGVGFYRPFWAPAYVSFWGWGGGFGFGFGWGGWGGFGWLPIGPCDWFHPWWGGYGGRFGVVGFRGGFNRFGGFAPLHGGTRFSNVANIHDPHIAHAMSTVNAGHFGTGRVMATAATREQINGARMMAGNLPVVPSRASLSASGRPAAPSTVRNGGSEHFFGAVHNNVARPASFQQQTASLRQTMQQNHVGAVPAGARANAGESGGFRGTTESSTGSGNMKPSAGALGGRETNSLGNRTAGNSPSSISPSSTSPSSAQNGGSRSFTPPGSHSTEPAGTERTNVGSSNMQPQRGATPPGSAGRNDGFRPFTPPPSSHSDVSRGESNVGSERGSAGGYWNRTAPSSQMHVNGPVYGGSERGYSRPQLDMRQPIVRSPSYGGGQSRPNYGGGGYHAPSYSGSHSAPSYGGSHGGGGGHASAPSGGHASGGGGGGHSSGGHH
jgi:uncharacterized protein DUF6600/FecR-like protein